MGFYYTGNGLHWSLALVLTTLMLSCGHLSPEEDSLFGTTVPHQITDLKVNYGAGCPDGWEYRQEASTDLAILLRPERTLEDRRQFTGAAPIIAGVEGKSGEALLNYSDAALHDPKVFLNEYASLLRYKLGTVKAGQFIGRPAALADFSDRKYGDSGRVIVVFGTYDHRESRLVFILTGDTEFRDEVTAALSGFQPLRADVRPPDGPSSDWKPCPRTQTS